MKITILILLSILFDILMWVALISLTIKSGIPLEWMMFASFFGGCLIVIFGGCICQNLANSNKKRHATRNLK